MESLRGRILFIYVTAYLIMFTIDTFRAIKTIPPERETNISSLKGIHLQLICMIPTERLIPAIQDSSKEAAYKFCLMFLDQCNLRQLDMNWHGTNLMTSIFVALQKERLGEKRIFNINLKTLY